VTPAIAPVSAWFADRGWTPFGFQIEAWNAYQDGQSGLIHASTGTGKTYAAWMGPLIEALGQPKKQAGLKVIWLTPMRALAADTAASLREPLESLGIPWQVETRTGDTTASVRNRQRKKLPDALVTTPESLSLLLARPDAQAQLCSLRAVIVDEWHELLASKRGVQAELCLARLRGWNPGLRTWGLSATLSNLDEALRALTGVADRETGEIPSGRIIRGAEPKRIEILSVIPETMERFPWAGHLGLNLLPQALEVIERAATSLVFCNTRAQTEIWYQALLEARPDWAGEIALHHGSLDRKTRDWVEQGLKLGRLRCVVATSSLDLGVDFAPVEAVLQVGSPKSVARLVQRSGRSGHQPGATSRVTCVPSHAFELIEIAAARDAVEAGHIEARRLIRGPLDVLAQHLVTVALGGGFTESELLGEVRTTSAFRSLSDHEWRWVLDFVTHGGSALAAYSEYHRLEQSDGRWVVTNPATARIHRMSIGTIVSDATLRVKTLRGVDMGLAEESFLSRLKPGDRFVLGGKVLEFVRIREMTAWVRTPRSRRGIVPRWYGGGFPLSAELTEAVRHRLQAARDGDFSGPEMRALRPILDLQMQWSVIPARDELLIERTRSREGHHLFVYPFAGRLVHEGLAALTAWRLARKESATISMSVNDYGYELLSSRPLPVEPALKSLFDREGLADDILHSLNESEMARRQFREIARIAGLVIERFPGGQKSARQLQASSGLIFDVFEKYDPGNLFLAQARREVLERQLEITRLAATLDEIGRGRITLVETRRFTPFAFPLVIERVRGDLSTETLVERIQAMQLQLERSAENGAGG